MATSTFSIFFLVLLSHPFLSLCDPSCASPIPANVIPVSQIDVDRVLFALNLEFLEAEFFLIGALGYGLDKVDPELARGGPSPIGAKKANLDPLTEDIVTQFAYQEVGHIRVIEATVGGFSRPLLDLSSENFAKLFDKAFGYSLSPPFDPYYNSLNYLLATYVIPYVGLNGYVGASPNLIDYLSKTLVAGLLGVEAGQDAVVRALLYVRAMEIVHPYNYTVADFTNRISCLRNELGMCGIKDEGLIVPPELGSENKTSGNILSADVNSLSYPRTPKEILRIVYNSGNEHQPGGFYPRGANGRIARDLLINPSE